MEDALKEFYGMDHAMVFSTGYQANLGMMSGLAGPRDTIYLDADSHSSIYDGCTLSGAKLVRFRHNDAADLDKRLTRGEADEGGGLRRVEGQGLLERAAGGDLLAQLVDGGYDAFAQAALRDALAQYFGGRYSRAQKSARSALAIQADTPELAHQLVRRGWTVIVADDAPNDEKRALAAALGTSLIEAPTAAVMAVSGAVNFSPNTGFGIRFGGDSGAGIGAGGSNMSTLGSSNYTINVNKSNMAASDIVREIQRYERQTGKKYLATK